MQPDTASSAPGPSLARRFFRYKESSALLALILIVILISVVAPSFLKPGNLTMVARQVAFTAIIALGIFFVILTAGIDLSVGSMVSLAGIIFGLSIQIGIPWPLAAPLGLASGVVVGSINGALVAYVGVTPFIVTLGMLGMASGAVYILTKGESVRKIPESFINFGGADVLGIPLVVIVLAIVAVIAHVLAQNTVFGRRVMAIGGNEEATELSGINVRRVKFWTYILSSLYASITGVLFVARFRTAQADAGKGLELDAIAAAVIGGTSLFGGEGSVLGVLIGAMVMGVIRNGLILMQVPSEGWQDFIIGAIIVLAAVVDVIRRQKAK
jgi:ribose transport system permease protein